MNNKKKDPNKDVIWFGIDGALVALYVVLGMIYSYGIINRVDWIVGIMVPVVALTICWSVFARYCYEVIGFIRKSDKK